MSCQRASTSNQMTKKVKTSAQDGERSMKETAQSGDSDGVDDVFYGGYIAAACAATNAVARPQVDLTDEEQRTKRLQMNRANAQRNRDRKKIMVDMLRDEKNQLAESNAELKKHIQELRNAIETIKASSSKKEGHQQVPLLPSQKAGTTAGTKRKLPIEAFPVDSRNVTQPQQMANPYAYRNNVVNVMARNLLLQEQLLAHRLSQVPQFLNPPPANPLLGIGETVVNPIPNPGEARVETSDNLQSGDTGSRGFVQLNPPRVGPQSNVISQNQLINLYYGGRPNMGFLTPPPVHREAQFQVPARSALLSSFTARGDADSLALGLTSFPQQSSNTGKKEESMKKKESDLM